MKTDTTFYILLLTLLPGVGPSCYWSLIEKYGSAKKVLLTSPPLRSPESLAGLKPEAKEALYVFQRKGENSPLANKAFKILEALEKHNAQIITHLSTCYPSLLKQIDRPPPIIYTKGNTDLLSLPQIAIVGTRNPTTVGLENARVFSRYLADGGFTITSGLALGIDAAAHEATLAKNLTTNLTKKGKTIAVMATGIDKLYPKKHQTLADAILEQNGLLITEFAPGIQAQATNFPRRNRIISGLSLGVLVIEAALKSGSLITARYALEQNREVFAIPNSIHSPQSKGCHALIKNGAQLVETGEDIIKQLTGILHHFGDQLQTKGQEVKAEQTTTNDTKTDKTKTGKEHNSTSSSKSTFSIPAVPPTVLSHKEKQILDAIGYDTVSIQQIIERTEFSSAEISTILINLEMQDLIKHSNWGYHVILKKSLES